MNIVKAQGSLHMCAVAVDTQSMGKLQTKNYHNDPKFLDR